METNAISLQTKIQKLIDQYTLDKKKLDELEQTNATLREENSQLMQQITASNDSKTNTSARISELEQQIKVLEQQYADLQNSLQGFESIASIAIDKIDNMFPQLESSH